MPSVLTFAIEALFRNGTGAHKQDIKRRMIDVRSSLDSVANESREHLNARNKTARSEEEVANLAGQESPTSRPDRTTKGYARICVDCRWNEGEGEIGRGF